MIRSQKLIGLVLISVLSALPSLAHSHWAYKDSMSKAEILAKIIGSTLIGSTSSGSTYSEYYTADGIVHGTDSKTGKYAAKWSIRDDDLMCWAYPPNFAIGGCVLLVLKGDIVKFQLINGSTEGPAKLVPGNPGGL
jgi:hypothetical protein